MAPGEWCTVRPFLLEALKVTRETLSSHPEEAQGAADGVASLSLAVGSINYVAAAAHITLKRAVTAPEPKDPTTTVTCNANSLHSY